MGLSSFSKHFFSDCDTVLAEYRTRVGELRDILRKRPIYNQVHWTAAQSLEFRKYWREHFGKSISPRCHKYCQFFTKRFDVRYFPETLVTTGLFFHLNPYPLTNLLGGKEWCEILLAGSSEAFPGVRTPKTLGIRAGGYCYDSGRNLLSFDRLCTRICDESPCVILKPLALSSGRGIEFYDLGNADGRASFQRSLKERPSFLVQEIQQTSESLRTLYPNAVSTFRVVTYVCGDEVFCCPSALRVGSGGGKVDNIHAGGMCVGIDERTETLKSTAYRLGYGSSYETFDTHPDTSISFDSYKIPGFAGILQAARKLHGKLCRLGLIAWDFSLGPQNEPVLIEINLSAPGTAFLQIANDQPLFGANTEKMIMLASGRRRSVSTS